MIRVGDLVTRNGVVYIVTQNVDLHCVLKEVINPEKKISKIGYLETTMHSNDLRHVAYHIHIPENELLFHKIFDKNSVLK